MRTQNNENCLRLQLACYKRVLSATIAGWQFKYNHKINQSFQPGVQILINHTISSRRRQICPKFILHGKIIILSYSKNKESCNRWSGPYRTLISTTLSWSGITWTNKRLSETAWIHRRTVTRFPRWLEQPTCQAEKLSTMRRTAAVYKKEWSHQMSFFCLLYFMTITYW